MMRGMPNNSNGFLNEMTDNLTNLEAFHEVPYNNIKNAYVEVKQEITDDPLAHKPTTHIETREGTIVGRGNGRGIRYDSSGANAYIETTIGPSIYLETPEETILEVRTDKPGNELRDFRPKEKVE